MSRNCAYKEAKEKGKGVKMGDLVGFFCLFVSGKREKNTKMGIQETWVLSQFC